MHLELADDLPTLAELAGLVDDVKMMLHGHEMTLAEILRATRQGITAHLNTQTGNALDILRDALNKYEIADVTDRDASTHQRNRMTAALATVAAMDALRDTFTA
jgi:hypothetical protein